MRASVNCINEILITTGPANSGHRDRHCARHTSDEVEIVSLQGAVPLNPIEHDLASPKCLDGPRKHNRIEASILGGASDPDGVTTTIH